tara:strand:- start:699 stop:2852 length:2154 start_codon:yes stop_codon:yes gene_type:complete
MATTQNPGLTFLKALDPISLLNNSANLANSRRDASKDEVDQLNAITTGALITDFEKVKKFVGIDNGQIKISFDGATAEDYNNITQVAKGTKFTTWVPASKKYQELTLNQILPGEEEGTFNITGINESGNEVPLTVGATNAGDDPVDILSQSQLEEGVAVGLNARLARAITVNKSLPSNIASNLLGKFPASLSGPGRTDQYKELQQTIKNSDKQRKFVTRLATERQADLTASADEDAAAQMNAGFAPYLRGLENGGITDEQVRKIGLGLYDNDEAAYRKALNADSTEAVKATESTSETQTGTRVDIAKAPDGLPQFQERTRESGRSYTGGSTVYKNEVKNYLTNLEGFEGDPNKFVKLFRNEKRVGILQDVINTIGKQPDKLNALQAAIASEREVPQEERKNVRGTYLPRNLTDEQFAATVSVFAPPGSNALTDRVASELETVSDEDMLELFTGIEIPEGGFKENDRNELQEFLENNGVSDVRDLAKLDRVDRHTAALKMSIFIGTKPGSAEQRSLVQQLVNVGEGLPATYTPPTATERRTARTAVNTLVDKVDASKISDAANAFIASDKTTEDVQEMSSAFANTFAGLQTANERLGEEANANGAVNISALNDLARKEKQVLTEFIKVQLYRDEGSFKEFFTEFLKSDGDPTSLIGFDQLNLEGAENGITDQTRVRFGNTKKDFSLGKIANDSNKALAKQVMESLLRIKSLENQQRQQ